MANPATMRAPRGILSFRTVNRPGTPTYRPDMQRHHLLPRQLLRLPALSSFIDAIGARAIGFDDFRANGLLLPASSQAALRTAMPLHRGPHRHYNTMVAERMGQVEGAWQHARRRSPDTARSVALWRIGLLQRALRRHLLLGSGNVVLNRRDPFRSALDFSTLDAMVDVLWAASG